MLEAFAAFGVEPTIKRLIGMFTIALWDRRERTLTLIRDRLGIAAVLGQIRWHLSFGSELKALRAFPGLTFAHRFRPGRRLPSCGSTMCPRR